MRRVGGGGCRGLGVGWCGGLAWGEVGVVGGSPVGWRGLGWVGGFGGSGGGWGGFEGGLRVFQGPEGLMSLGLLFRKVLKVLGMFSRLAKKHNFSLQPLFGHGLGRVVCTKL